VGRAVHIWTGWRSALAIVKPETVVAWHRAGFRLFWTWKMRRGQPGRPVIAREVRDLIRQMCRENPGWGAPRIHGELLKLGIDIGESSVSKYMVRCPKPPSQTWHTFLDNHLTQLVSIDFRVEEIPVGFRLPLAVSAVSGFVPV
jgi:putative transposase